MTLMERLEAKYEPEPNSGCWLWTAGATGAGGGYGYIYAARRMRRAHVVLYELLVGPVASGLELDHRCRNTRCVNPGHLRPVTHQQNMQASPNMGRANLAKTHCPSGHEYDEANTSHVNGRRQCRECGRTRSRERARRLSRSAR